MVLDAVFKKRGIDPEDFWRSAGLPAFKFPDPNGTRFSNGAPPPAPPALEGTRITGTGCGARIAVLVCAAARAVAAPRRPDAVRECRSRAGSLRAERAVSGVTGRRLVAAEPRRIAPTPGIPIAGRPGQVQPDVPGAPVPIAPGPPGARTEPLGPLPGPAPANPAAAPPPAAWPPGPPAPPGPGNNLPAPASATQVEPAAAA